MNRAAIAIGTAAAACAWAGLFVLTLRTPYEAPATPIRLIGECNGQLMGAMEESAFPEGCAWTEPVRWEAAR